MVKVITAKEAKKKALYYSKTESWLEAINNNIIKAARDGIFVCSMSPIKYTEENIDIANTMKEHLEKLGYKVDVIVTGLDENPNTYINIMVDFSL